jgi:geranylgeranyl diphosphate synthase type I
MSLETTVAAGRPAREVLGWSRQQVEPALREAVATLPPTIRQIAGYHFGWWDADGTPTGAAAAGGKAIRPALTLLAAEAAGGEAATALPAAAAVELVHNFSLVQDDVIDADLTRRHRPTVWSVFGAGAAIVAGDALLALGIDVLSASDHPAAQPAVRMLNAATLELIEGQHADLAFEDRTDVDLVECLRMATDKCGALMGCACALGGLLGGGSGAQVTLLRRFGEQLGVAFQLTDDLLGIWGDPAVTGKPAYSDLHRRKKTLPLVAALTSGTDAGAELADLYHREQPLSGPELARAAELVAAAGGRDWCRSRARDLLYDALRALRSAIDPAPGPARAAAELGALARLAVHRDH